jgi:NADPH:quinone reductase-like Zn-dependent oxidoreductase
MAYRGAIAVSGLTGGIDVHTTVIPFILRGVKLLGIDSVMCPAETRLEVWRRLATDLRPTHLDRVAKLIGLDDLPAAFTALLKGEAQGRYVVRLRG